MLVDITGLAIWWLVIGAVLFLGGVAAMQGRTWGRIVGIIAAGLAAVSEFFMIPYYPIWSITLLALYVIVLCAFVSWRAPVMAATPIVAPEPVPRSYVPPAPDMPPAPEVMAAAAVVGQAPAATPDVRRAYDLIDIEGVGPAYAEKLGALGLRTTDDLLKAGASPKGREDLAATTAISSKLILRWVNMADLFRIKGVGEEYSDLLEAAGVDTVSELAQRRADNLWAKMTEVNEQKQLVRRLPTQDQVAEWIESAKNMPRMVTY